MRNAVLIIALLSFVVSNVLYIAGHQIYYRKEIAQYEALHRQHLDRYHQLQELESKASAASYRNLKDEERALKAEIARLKPVVDEGRTTDTNLHKIPNLRWVLLPNPDRVPESLGILARCLLLGYFGAVAFLPDSLEDSDNANVIRALAAGGFVLVFALPFLYAIVRAFRPSVG